MAARSLAGDSSLGKETSVRKSIDSSVHVQTGAPSVILTEAKGPHQYFFTLMLLSHLEIMTIGSLSQNFVRGLLLDIVDVTPY